jgi:hypothetical protein
MSKLKITKFGLIHESKEGNIIISDFELKGDNSGDTYVNTIDAIIEHLESVKQDHIKDLT